MRVRREWKASALVASPLVAATALLGACVSDRPNVAPRAASHHARENDAGISWQAVVRVDLDGDGAVDNVRLGAAEREVLVAVTLAGKPGAPTTLRFPWDGTRQDGVCGDPALARLVVEDQAVPVAGGPEGAAAPVKGGEPRRVLQGVRLESGECDAFHFFYDGHAVMWWRR